MAWTAPDTCRSVSIAERLTRSCSAGSVGRDRGRARDAGTRRRGDKVDLDFPGLQPRLLESIVLWASPPCWWSSQAARSNLAWAHDHVGAIVQAFYPGEEAGSALADILFGDVILLAVFLSHFRARCGRP